MINFQPARLVVFVLVLIAAFAACSHATVSISKSPLTVTRRNFSPSFLDKLHQQSSSALHLTSRNPDALFPKLLKIFMMAVGFPCLLCCWACFLFLPAPISGVLAKIGYFLFIVLNRVLRKVEQLL
ncbi:hypothetical protein BVRB_028440 [Beta vulgaris subsp. vulgaris]|uniref:Transmembrane protein n=1 Tax=Beta vulgaris subsp. vulgaris TaxID=3555 RepID=A0A0J8DSL9_BETVV|nr:hypothetical protein BVRB_028440 [Beta vulgaris subsp. vulgaris]